MKEPERPRAIAYIDLQWWFRASKFCFDTQYPTFNPKKLAKEVCRTNNWELDNTKCYLDFPAPDVSAFGLNCGACELKIFKLRYVNLDLSATYDRCCVLLIHHRVTVRSDADIMLRQSLDIHSDVLRNRVDVVLLFSKENKYIELVESIKKTAREEDRWIKIVTVYPYQEGRGKAGYAGINHTDWECVDSHMYKSCSERIRKPQRAEQDFAEDTALDVASTSVE